MADRILASCKPGCFSNVTAMRWAATSVLLRVSPIDSFSATVLTIQRKQKVCKNLGSSTFDRWIFAILGPVPKMIKMASFTGTPLTNMYANSFVACFIFTEPIIVTTPEDLHVGALHREMEMQTWRYPHQVIRDTRRKVLQEALRLFDLGLAVFPRGADWGPPAWR